MSPHAQRGVALPETALVLATLLLALFGALRVGVIGYNQISADGAAFLSSHESALGAVSPWSVAAGVFPAAKNAVVTQTQQPAPSMNVPVDYGFSDSTNRHGGVSVMQPMQQLTTVSTQGIDAPLPLGGPAGSVTVHGLSADPAYREVGVHMNIDGDAFNSTSAFENAQDYFSAGENTPPYFVGFHYMQYCVPSGTATYGPDGAPWHDCPSGQSEFLALGLAEFLDDDNWGCPSNGVGPGSTFNDLLTHQQAFATISSEVDGATDAATASGYLTQGNATIQQIYGWDSSQPGGYPQNYTSVGQYPLHPGQPC